MPNRCLPRTNRVATCGLAIVVVLVLHAFATTVCASDLRRTPIVRVVESASPAVVNIHGQKTVDQTTSSGRSKQVNGMGTGVIIDPRGYILTNFHVVDGVRTIEVGLEDGESTIAQLIARDHSTDLAVIKIIKRPNLPVICIGTSSDLMKGEPVVAIGNAYGYEHTVTNGIISHLHRDVQVSDTLRYGDLIQTSASINPGNSGGPLLNIDGEMIGVNVAVRAGAQNIGFAIPVDNAMRVAARLMSVEKMDGNWHGMCVNGAGSDGKPAVVRDVLPNSPAAKSGIQPGDEIRRVGSLNTSRALDIERALLGQTTGKPVTIEIRRDGQIKELNLALASRSQRRTADEPINRLDRNTWDILGVQLEEIAKADFNGRQTRYRGGLRVAQVRGNSPASAQGIRRGDVLVGMHRWETASVQDVRYIVGRKDLAQISPVKFYLLREGEPRTLYGYLRLASPATGQNSEARR